MKVFRQSCMEVVPKIDVLQSAAAGDQLTDRQKTLLLEMADDYRPLVALGSGKIVTAQHCIEAFRLLTAEVPMMVGENRRRCIALLHDIKARGFENASVLPMPDEIDARFNEGAALDVTPDEIAEVLDG